MVRKPNEYIELSGGIFEPALQRRIWAAIGEGMEEIADEGDDIMAGYIAAGGFVDTGELLASVDAVHVKKGDGPGYIKILPTAVYPEPDRPTRTWIAKGTRGGVKLRPGYNIFARTATALRKQGYNDMILRRIQMVLN